MGANERPRRALITSVNGSHTLALMSANTLETTALATLIDAYQLLHDNIPFLCKLKREKPPQAIVKKFYDSRTIIQSK